ncbi:hypothetical protein [Salinimicrobium sediminilitoris]|uniref:hypothetical protein n=1 Tax=Salinimicrobium sediminilitoris TaxID=2876715 RepID=UPI001E3FE592|nr:hypothetical protein [Salinimicrobium sediminilitoris]MCC8360050.1 hypothetical protein [Salinimicrobium sediminilitoris]
MNKIRIIGAVLFCIGITGHFLVDTEDFGFWTGAAMGAGVTMLLIGKLKWA